MSDDGVLSSKDAALLELLGVHAYRSQSKEGGESGGNVGGDDVNSSRVASDVAVEEVKKLLLEGAHAWAFDDVTGATALMAACGAGNAEVARELLMRGAPWNACDRRGKCAGGKFLFF